MPPYTIAFEAQPRLRHCGRVPVHTRDGDAVCTGCGTVLNSRMRAQCYASGKEIADYATSGGSCVSSGTATSTFRHDEGTFARKAADNNRRAKKMDRLARSISCNQREDDIAQYTRVFATTLNLECVQTKANHIITLWNLRDKAKKKLKGTYRARKAAALAALVLASRLRAKSVPTMSVVLAGKLTHIPTTKIGQYVREMNTYLQSNFQLKIPSCTGVSVCVRWANNLHKYGSSFFVETAAAVPFLRSMLRLTTFEESTIASSPDVVAAAFLWLCSAILRQRQPLCAEELQAVASGNTTRKAINNLLQQCEFLKSLTYELPPEFDAVISALAGRVVSGQLELRGKKKS